MEEEKFRVRCYDKNELAKMYFPKLSDHVSVAKLRRWIRNCTPLMEELATGDFQTENVQRTGSTPDRALSGRAGWICTGKGTSGHQLTAFSE